MSSSQRNDLFLLGGFLLTDLILFVTYTVIIQKTPKDQRKQKQKEIQPTFWGLLGAMVVIFALLAIHNHRQDFRNMAKKTF